MAYMNLQVKKNTAAAKQFLKNILQCIQMVVILMIQWENFIWIFNYYTANAEKYYKMSLEKYPFNISSEALEKIEAGKKK